MAKFILANMPSFNESSTLQEWTEAFHKNELDGVLRHHWSRFVPLVFSRGHDTEKEQRYLYTFLLHPMERFLCDGEPSERFQRLKELDIPTQICGHVFRSGEPTYSCRVCATDPTCVLCINCFQKSQHRNHKYRDSVHNLPLDLQERVSVLFLSLMRYIVELLTWDDVRSVPPDILLDEQLSDDYHCMLYNDEVHTFDQVITTLQRYIECTNRQAIDFATTVDREGRASVCQGGADVCDRARASIQEKTGRHSGRQLKVTLLHKLLVSHQMFVLRCVDWLKTVINKTDGLRRLFCLLSMKETDGASMMERLILSDTKLWKAARVASHQLLMSGVLKDQECKRLFSMLFTKHYPQIGADFITDDHDHDVSISSLSVQIFTVPSLARMLIAEHDLLDVILKVFLDICHSRKSDKGRLSSELIDRSPVFKRATYMLHDLKYALLCKPTQAQEWTDQLRTGVLNGLRSLLTLLTMMQGIDAVVRQVSHHLEFEMAWEGAFNLQLKLEDIVKLFLDWCSADRSLLIEAYTNTMNELHQCREKLEKYKVTVSNTVVKCVRHDVRVLPVSIIIPLTRFFAGLYLHLEKYGLRFDSPELTTQIYFYQNVRCREEMYNKDIVLLQIAASLVPPDEFVIHCLNKYGLVSWSKLDYDTPGAAQDGSLRQTITLAEEFLHLLIIIVGERYQPGVGQIRHDDAVKREIIHLLCISPLAHSKLAKNLQEDVNHETGLEDVVLEVADFKESAGGGTSKYELKSEFHSQYSPFFFHYSKSDQSKSEEAERRRRKQNGEDQALPPPPAPMFTDPFRPVLRVLQSDVLIDVISTVFTRTAASRSRSWSEAQFDRALFLVGMALNEQMAALRSADGSFRFLAKTVGKGKLLEQLESLTGCCSISQDTSNSLLIWVLKKYHEALELSGDTECMPKLISLTKSSHEHNLLERKGKAVLAAKRRARVMAQMSRMQKDFIAENSGLFAGTNTDPVAQWSETEVRPDGQLGTVALGPNQTQVKNTPPISVTCILCQEEEVVSLSGPVMVLAAYVQMSTVLSLDRSKHLANVDQYDPLLLSADLFNGTHTSSCGHCMHQECWLRFFQSVLNKERRRMYRFGTSNSYDVNRLEYLCPLCEGLSNTVIPIIPSLLTLRPGWEKKDVTLEFDDWLDGIHKTAINSVQKKEVVGDFHLLLMQPCPLSTITRLMAESVARNFQLLWDYGYREYITGDDSQDFSDGLKEMVLRFTRDVYVFGLDVKPGDDDVRMPVMAWNTCAFTIMAVERDLASGDEGIFGSTCERQSALLGALVRFAATVNRITTRDVICEHCVKLLSLLIPEKVEDLVPEAECLLAVDMFHFLVSLTLSIPSLHGDDNFLSSASSMMSDVYPLEPFAGVPSGGLNDQHVLTLVFIVHLVQILLSYNYQPSDGRGPDEFSDLCTYLALPSDVYRLFTGNNTRALVKSWCCSRTLRERLSSGAVVGYPRPVSRLTPLPADYSEVISQALLFTCPNSESNDSRAPTLCLACGAMLCSQSYCCQTEVDGHLVGAATLHASTCGAGAGIFLRVRDCQVLMLSSRNTGCFLAAPYQDVYGETDPGFRRGNPLSLSDSRFSSIQKTWRQHGIPQAITRSLNHESSMPLAFDWSNL